MSERFVTFKSCVFIDSLIVGIKSEEYNNHCLLLQGHIPGELSRKSVAAAFWECELYNELLEMNLVEEWSFTKEKTYSNSSGSKNAAVEFIVCSQVTTSYDHICYEGCLKKGRV